MDRAQALAGVTTTPAPGYKLDCIKVNGTAIEGNSFIAEADADYVVTAEFAFYRNVTDHGTCGSNLVWTLYENNELAISGTGTMDNYNTYRTYAPWYNYRSIIETVVIDEGLTTIGDYAFSECCLVESIVFPSSINRIGTCAFRNCSSLSGITLPASLSYVGYDAFSGCNLQSVHFAGTVSDWLRIEFDGYTCVTQTNKLYFDGELIEELVIPDGTTRIPDYAFRYYRGLRSVSFPDTLQAIGLNAFRECSSLDHIEFPDGLESIETLTLNTIPSSIPPRCFSGCASLQKIIFANHIFEIGELVLPEGIESVEDRAFSGCTAITSVTLPASLTYIDSGAFSGSGLERFAVASGNLRYSTDNWGVLYNLDKTALVQYPPCRKWPYYNVAASASSIGYQAFSGCENLVNLYVPNTVTSISGSAIQNCPNLTLCCYIGSAAYRYALDNSLTAWYMDNKTLQGIRVYSLPEQTVQVLGRVNMQGLYVVGNYQGKELQIDDYTVNYDKSSSGVKTVTVEYQGKTVTFGYGAVRLQRGQRHQLPL